MISHTTFTKDSKFQVWTISTKRTPNKFDVHTDIPKAETLTKAFGAASAIWPRAFTLPQTTVCGAPGLAFCNETKNECIDR